MGEIPESVKGVSAESRAARAAVRADRLAVTKIDIRAGRDGTSDDVFEAGVPDLSLFVSVP